MKKIVFFSILIIFLNIGQAYAKNFEYNTDIELRALYGYFEPAEKFKNNTKKQKGTIFFFCANSNAISTNPNANA